jgi:transcriptional antiterminator NusG
VTEVRRGKKVTSDRKFFPGYVLAKLAMNDDVYHLIKNTPKVTGFLGAMGKPQPISDAEAARILNTKEEAAAAAPKTKVSVDYEIGDQVKVLEGPVRQLQRHRRGTRFRPQPRQGLGLHLRPRHPGRAGIRAG